MIDFKNINLNDPALAGCIITYSGKIVNLWNIDPESITLKDIAHGLAYNCRWNGHTKARYSIAEHCIRVYDRVPEDMKLLALFHDAEEAYWGNIIQPLKILLKEGCPELIEKMKQTRQAIFQKFKIEDRDEYKEFDNEELMWDFQNLVLSHNHKPLSADLAKVEWLHKVAKCFLIRDHGCNFKY